MCIGAFKDLEDSSLQAIMELAFASEKIMNFSEDHKIVRSRSLPSMPSPSITSPKEKNNSNQHHLYRSSSDDFTSTTQMASTNLIASDISARTRSNMYSEILDAEEEALGLSPTSGYV